MDSKLVVTYKRKRLFSRRYNDCTDLNPDAPSETSESKTLKKVNNREESTTAEYVLRKDTEFGIHQEYSEGNLVEDVVQCEFCDSHGECSELHRLLSACTKQQDSSVSDENEKDAKKMKFSPTSDVEQITVQPKLLSEGNNAAEEKSAEPQSKLLFVKPSSEYGDKSEEKKSISSPPILGTLNLEETDKISKDQRSSSCSNLATKRRLDSNLITFRRRVKRSNNVATRGIDSKDAEKKQSDVDIANSCSFSAPAPETAVIAHVDKSPLLPQETATDTPADVAQVEILSSLQGNVSMDAQNNNHHINDKKPENISNDDVATVRVRSDTSGKKDSLLSLDLSISRNAALDIDCNRPLDCGSDENHTIPTALRDKGKLVIESPPTSAGPTSYKNSYFQLFPENRTDDVPQKVGPLRPPPTSQHSSYFNSGHAAYSSSYAWPNIQLQQQQPREAFHEFLQHPNLNRAESSFSRQKMTMLDNALTRARAVRGSNRSSFLDRFEPPTIWSEEELDCLWIGVRRHGKGNWDSIRMDRRLIFSPWKTAHDLAERWLYEQARIFSYNNPAPQVHYAGPPQDHWSSHFTNPPGDARQSYAGGSLHRPLLHHPPMTNNKKLEKQSTNVGSSSNAGQVKGNLPHWLKEAVQVPSSGMRWQNQPNFQSTEYPNKRATTTNAPLVIGNASKKKELIVITSDASSEETISDDRGGRP
ncbi:hypothetical protein ABFS82_11G023500 [Erythranthe guttata]|uniref:uncharacterized protein LOC105976635 n=1 Tax=Erythranthe guttata TaxID=4155 RepID=UPI00064DC80C|nr:PREDICTED: uncharacterized protein LOC105976635 [Erythranthe guttata]|eukprot:XP_012857341.1 PREDICTED: uncharacterized protein LOC105976635 [Erythranthe guttata]